MRLAAAAGLTLLLLCRAGEAHVPLLRGHLVELVEAAQRIVIVRVDAASRRPGGGSNLKVSVAANLFGATTPKTFSVRSAAYLAPGARYVLFVHQQGDETESIAGPGTVFATSRATDASYRRTVSALLKALKQPEPGRSDAVRAALIDALTSPAEALRYHAALDLNQLVSSGHPPTASEAKQLERLATAEDGDPALRQLLTTLLHSAPAGTTPPTPLSR